MVKLFSLHNFTIVAKQSFFQKEKAYDILCQGLFYKGKMHIHVYCLVLRLKSINEIINYRFLLSNKKMSDELRTVYSFFYWKWLDKMVGSVSGFWHV